MVGKTDHVDPAEQVTASTAGGSASEHGGLRGKFQHLSDKLKGTKLHDLKISAIHTKHTLGRLQNLANRNHRHDEPHEIRTDAKRTKIAEGHRFQSFAPERDHNAVKWYVDGRDMMYAVSLALEQAQETIYIMDWWLSPELFLRRPPLENQQWRLDAVLKRAAERGVKIFVILYREVAMAITCNSAHSKHVLEALCPEGTPGHGNIKVMRHPDHNTFENMRWDVRQHPLACVHPGGVGGEVWPGQDFNNNRIADFKDVNEWKNNEVSKADSGRMPWHDVHMAIEGPCVYDIAEQFILRWNFIKRDKYKRDAEYDWITLTGRTGEDEDLIGVQRPKHPVGEYIHHPLSPLEHKKGNPNRSTHDHGTHDPVQSGLDRHDAEDVDEHGYTSDQHQRGHGLQKDFKKFSQDHHLPHLHKKENTNPEMTGEHQQQPKHTGNNPKKEGMITASGGVAEKQKGYESKIIAETSDPSANDLATVHAQVVRSAADWSSGILTESSIQNAYCQVIREAKHFVYIENQFFITSTDPDNNDPNHPVSNLIGEAIVEACVRAGKEGRKFRVLGILPAIPGFAGDLRSPEAVGTRAIMDYQYRSICRGPNSIFGRIKAAGVDPTEHIFFFNLRSYDRINFTPALKEREQKSGVKYVEVQRAHAEEIMTTGLHHTSSAGGKDEIKLSEKAKQERDEVLARRKKFEGDANDDTDQQPNSGTVGSVEVGRDPDTGSRDTIAHNAMLEGRKVSEEPWAGRDQNGQHHEGLEADDLRQTELQHIVQEELYVHSKLLIVDDRIVICGSSNINDRSQLGFHDSELCLVMEDTRPLQTTMDGAPYTAGFHAASLRRTLWREHLGLLPPQSMSVSENEVNARLPGDGANEFYEGDEWDKLVADPMNDELWKLWTDRATTNTKVFRHLFHADPDDHIKSFQDYDHFVGKQGSRQAGHIYDLYAPVDIVRRELDRIKGHLVWMPLEFLCDETMAERGLQVNSWTESIYT